VVRGVGAAPTRGCLVGLGEAIPDPQLTDAADPRTPPEGSGWGHDGDIAFDAGAAAVVPAGLTRHVEARLREAPTLPQDETVAGLVRREPESQP